MPKRGTEAAVETDMMIARVRELVNPKKPESKTTFISTIERTFDVSGYTTAPFLHLELRGVNSHLISNPFFLK